MTAELIERLAGADPAAAEGAADRLLGLAEQLRTAATGLPARTPGWRGQGARAAEASAAELGQRLRTCADDCETVALALRAVGQAVASYRAQAATARRILEVEAAAGVANPYGAELASAAVSRQLAAAWTVVDRCDARAAAAITATQLVRLFAPSPAPGVLAPYPTPALSRSLLAGTLSVRPRPRAPGDVAVWWAGLDPAARTEITDGWDVLVGRGDGLPVDVRDADNRRRLAGALEAARAAAGEVTVGDIGRQLAGDVIRVLPWPLSTLASSRPASTRARKRLADLTAVAAVAARPGRRLLYFDEDDGGQAVIVAGDLERASALAVLVPGMNTDLGDLPRLDGQVTRIAAEAGAGAVGVVWLGYDAPGIREVVSDGTARSAVQPLDAFVSGLRAVGSGPQRLTVVGHSYGSLVVGLAGRRPAGWSQLTGKAQDTLQADELVFAGSPGVGADSVADLVLAADRVWAARSSTDPIQLVFWPDAVSRRLGLPRATVFGPDPTSAGFGARRIDVGGTRGHSSYFDSGTRSLPEIGAVVAGRPVRGMATG